MSLDCLDNIIGLSETPCDCWDDQKQPDFNDLNASSSGLYVSQPNTIPVKWTNSAADCENQGVWNLLLSARNEAVRSTLKDFLTEVSISRDQRFLPYTMIGDNYFRQAGRSVGTFAGAYIEPYCIHGAKLRVTSVDIAFFSGIVGPTNVEIFIYSSLDLVNPITSAVATVTANATNFKTDYATATFATPFEIDLGDVRTDLNERFLFVYEIPAGAVPVQNDTEKGCNCSSRRNSRLYYRDNPYLAQMTVGGLQANSIAGFSSPVFGGGGMNGLVINASTECDYYTWLCELAQTPNDMVSVRDGQRLNLGMALADTIQAAAVINLAKSILNSKRINCYSMVLDAKGLVSKINEYSEVYQNGIKYLAYMMPADVSDCLKCKEGKAIRKGSIIS